MIADVGRVVDGVLVNAVVTTGRHIVKAIRKGHRSRREDDFAITRWFDTYQLTSRVLELPDVPPELAGRLIDVLYSDETQAALHDLLAARLARATAVDAGQARKAFYLTLTWAVPEAASVAETLADYFDDQICELVARLESQEHVLLEQIRSEALPTRIIATLRAIERHTAALSSRPDLRSEECFIASYQRHVVEQHGKLVPPDFDQRRLVPIEEIYAPTVIVEEEAPPTAADQAAAPRELDVWQLAQEIDRSVLLGDPGGGKTTAAKVLMYHFANLLDGEQERRVPFLVTLREYAATYPLKYSVVRHIEHEMETFYQCPPPPGLRRRLCLELPGGGRDFG